MQQGNLKNFTLERLIDHSELWISWQVGSVACLGQWAQDARKAMFEVETVKLSQDTEEIWLRLVQGLRKVV